MKKTVRGLVLFPVVAGVVIFVGGAVIGAVGMYAYGKMHSGGLGDSVQAGISLEMPSEMPETAVISETVLETVEITEPTTEPLSEAVTEAFGAVTVVIDGNDYYYQDSPIALDRLTAILHYTDDENLSVRIIKQNASRNASLRLKNALEKEMIPYMEQNADTSEPTETQNNNRPG